MGKRKEKKAFLEKRNLWEAGGEKKQNFSKRCKRRAIIGSQKGKVGRRKRLGQRKRKRRRKRKEKEKEKERKKENPKNQQTTSKYSLMGARKGVLYLIKDIKHHIFFDFVLLSAREGG